MKNPTSQTTVASKMLFCLALVVILFCGSSAFAQNGTIFGPNVYVFDTTYSVSSIISTLTRLNRNTQFDTKRYGVLLKPGTYSAVEAEVGYSESGAGQGETTSAVH